MRFFSPFCLPILFPYLAIQLLLHSLQVSLFSRSLSLSSSKILQPGSNEWVTRLTVCWKVTGYSYTQKSKVALKKELFCFFQAFGFTLKPGSGAGRKRTRASKYQVCVTSSVKLMFVSLTSNNTNEPLFSRYIWNLLQQWFRSLRRAEAVYMPLWPLLVHLCCCS